MTNQFYSQAGEDKFLFDRFVENQAVGSRTYLEMGALDGVKYSNTKYFDETLGWTGILIEPHPEDFKRLSDNRPTARLYNKVVSNRREAVSYSYFDNANLSAVSGITDTLTEKNIDKFFENDDPWYQKMRENALKEITMEPVTLDWVLQDAGFDELFLCSIDVEGHELNVLESYSFDKDITLFLIENNPQDSEIEQLMTRNGYTLWGRVAHNRVFIANHRSDLLAVAA